MIKLLPLSVMMGVGVHFRWVLIKQNHFSTTTLGEETAKETIREKKAILMPFIFILSTDQPQKMSQVKEAALNKF